MKKALFFCFSLCLLLTAFCAQGEEAVAYVNGEPILASQLVQRMQSAEFLSAQAATSLTDQQKEANAGAMREAALSALIEEAALLQAAGNLGITPDIPAVQENEEQLYQRMIAAVENYVLVSYPTLEGQAMDEQVDALLSLAGSSRETYRQTAQRAAILAALDEALSGQLSQPSQQEIQDRYQQLYEEQKALFDGDQNAFEAAMLQGNIVVYRPVGLKLIQKIEFLFDKEASALIRQAALVNEALADEMRTDQYRILANQVEEIYKALIGGEVPFASVMEEWKAGSSQKFNYFHETSTRFDEAYYSRAAAFETVGEISTAYILPNGYAILYYAGDLPAASQVPLSEVEEQIHQALVEEGEKGGLSQAKQEIVAAADVVLVEGDSP